MPRSLSNEAPHCWAVGWVPGGAQRAVHCRVVPDERVVLVCLHGLAASSRWWLRVLDDLEASGPVVLLDFPLTLPPGEFADWVAMRLERLDPPVDLVGHSLGALVAVRVAALRPELVRRLVLIAPPGIEPQRSPIGYVWSLLASLLRCRPRFLIRLTVDALRAGPRNIVRGWLYIAAADTTSGLTFVRAPTLLVWGARDRLVPSSAARLWQEAMPHAELHVIPGSSHVPMFEAPAELVAAITAFREKGADEFCDPVRM